MTDLVDEAQRLELMEAQRRYWLAPKGKRTERYADLQAKIHAQLSRDIAREGQRA